MVAVGVCWPLLAAAHLCSGQNHGSRPLPSSLRRCPYGLMFPRRCRANGPGRCPGFSFARDLLDHAPGILTGAMIVELWTLTHSRPSNALNVARRAEAAGWNGMLVVDSQNLAADSYVGLAVAAAGTQTIGLGTGVTNTVTRHPAVTASAAMAVQDVSVGRMFLGIGRGDSALAHLGRSPARFAGFEQYVEVLQRYLRGEAVPFDEIPMADEIAAPLADLELADHPDASRIRWFKTEVAKVPVEVAATGPRVIAMAGRLADR